MSLSHYVRPDAQLELQELDADNSPVGPKLWFPADYLDAEPVNDLDLDAAVNEWQRHVTTNDPELLVGELPIDQDRPERVLMVHGRLFRAQLVRKEVRA